MPSPAPPCIARSNAARSEGFSASQLQKSWQRREEDGLRAVGVELGRRPIPRASPQVGHVLPPATTYARLLANTPGSTSAKTRSLATARNRRYSVSWSAPTSRASSLTGRGPPASASATPRSARTASARVPSAPRIRFHSTDSGACSFMAALCRSWPELDKGASP